MDPGDMTPESHDFVGKKTLANFRWTSIIISFMLSCLVEQANLGLKSNKGFQSCYYCHARAISAGFNMVVNGTYVNNRLWHVRKIWLIIKRKLKSLSCVSWDDTEKKIIMRKEEYQIYIHVSNNLEFMTNNLYNIYALTLIIECVFYIIRHIRGRRLISIN